MARKRNHFTQREDELLVQYIAENHPQVRGRLGNQLYAKLEDNPLYPWSKTHPWSSWRERYKTNQAEFDRRIQRYLIGRNLETEEPVEPPRRNAFTEKEDRSLCKYIAKYNPQLKGRKGLALYKKLVENAEGKWNWSKNHPWQGWRSRYVDNAEWFDEEIAKYQAQDGIRPSSRTISDEQHQSNSTRPSKRQRTMVEEDKQEDEKPKAVQSTGDEYRSDGLAPKVESINGQSDSNAQKGVEENGHDGEDDDSDGDMPPPGSEDYHGQIFSASDANDSSEMNVSESASGESEDEDQVEHDHALQEPPVEEAMDCLNPPPSGNTNERIQSPKPNSEPEPEVEKPSISDSVKRNVRSRNARQKADDDPFEDYLSPPPERSPLPSRSRKRPAILTESSFRTGFKRKRALASLDGDEDEDVSFPRLTPHSVNGKGANRAKDNDADNQASLPPTISQQIDSHSPKRRTGEKPNQVPSLPPTKSLHSRLSGQSHIPQNPHRRQSAKPAQTVNSSTTRDAALVQKRSNSFPSALSFKKSQTSEDNIYSAPSRYVNLRYELATKQPVREPSRRLPFPVSEEDQLYLQELAVRHLSEEFGFKENIVRQLWNELKSLSLVRNALADMRESADRSMNSWIRSMSRGSDGMNTPDSLAKSASIQQGNSKNKNTAKPRKSLDIKLIADNSMDLDYDPPSGSRARKYTRLAKMGREDEALERERRRVSGSGISPRRYSQQVTNNPPESLRDETVDLADQVEDVFLDDILQPKAEPDAPAESVTVEPKREEEEVILRSNDLETTEVEDLTRGDIDRWKEVEHLFLSANWRNVNMLKEIEQTFDPEFLLDWLCNKATLEL